MEGNKRIKIKKLASGIVSYRIPGQMVARRWRGRNAVQIIPYSELEQCIYDPDIKTLFDYGYLFIDDKEARIELGYESENEEVETTQFLILEKSKITQLLYSEKVTKEEFEKKIKILAPETAELLVEVATETEKHAGYDKYEIIKKYLGVDVEEVKKRKREDSV